MCKSGLWGVKLWLLLSGGIVCLGQLGSDGSILGVVTDQSGAAVPGAEIAVANTATGFKRIATSDGAGNFEILALPIGSYSITVSAQGFKKWVLKETTLTVGERKRLTPVLEIGQLIEQVSVQSAVELVQTDKSSVEAVVEERQV